MLPETTSLVYTGPFPARWSGWNFEHLINDTFVSTTVFLHKGILLCIFAGIKPITFRSLTQAAWLCFSSCLRVSSIQVQSGQWKGALDLCILSHQNGKWWRADFFCVCVPTDGEDDRGAGHGRLGVQPRLDQRRCHAATRQPERGGKAAVDVSRPQLDPPTVRFCDKKCIFSWHK